MKPLIKWSGGKSDELSEIVKYLPTSYDTYVEPFIGGGAVFWSLEPQKAVINDIHPELITFYKEVQAGNAPIIHSLMTQHPNDETTYYHVRDEFRPSNPTETAFQFYYLRKTCYRGMLRYNKSGKFNIPFGRYKKPSFDDILELGYHQLLQRTTILNLDFEEVFRNYNSSENFCFIDQPYDSVFTDYGYCSFDKSDQERLAKCFKETEMKCLMIVGETPFIRELYDGYIAATYHKKYRFKLHSGRVGDNINNNHLVIKNYS
jgi:DNA adenine methylase